MKKLIIQTKIMKEAAILLLVTLLLISSAVAMANRGQKQESGRVTGYTMVVENSTTFPGAIGHTIEVTGSYEEEIFRYIIHLDYGPTQAVGDINVTEVNLDGCVGEDPAVFSWNVYKYGDHGHIYALIIYNQTTPGSGIPPGQGKLINIILDVAPTAESQVIPIFANTTFSTYYHIISGPVDTEVIDGYLEISTNQPPETPDQPEGPTSGAVGAEYTYTTNPVADPNGDDVEYLFDWGDGNNSGWLSSPNASYAWSLAGTYEVTVKARDVPEGAESEWSEPLSVEITDQEPELEIESISGGFGITAIIKNNGEVPATDVKWCITLGEGLIILGKVTSNTISSIPAGGSAEIKSNFIIGFGKITITVTAEYNGGLKAEKLASGFVIVFIVGGVK